MSRNIVIALLLVVAGIVVVISSSGDVSTYATFQQAQSRTEDVKVVGQLSKDKPITYDPENNPNEFSFYMTDNDAIEKLVVVHKPKPQDFEMSEQIVVTGKISDGQFEASDLLMKCPSKYKNEEIAIKEQQG